MPKTPLSLYVIIFTGWMVLLLAGSVSNASRYVEENKSVRRPEAPAELVTYSPDDAFPFGH